MFTYKDPMIVSYLRVSFEKYIPKNKKNIVILCIGTDRITGDSLGPLVGYFIQRNPKYERLKKHFDLYGTIDEPITAKNIKEKLDEIHSKYESPYIIAIDASLSLVKPFGTIDVMDQPLSPGQGIGKDLPKTGDMHITGVVGIYNKNGYDELQNVRLGPVLQMAESIGKGIVEYIDKNCN